MSMGSVRRGEIKLCLGTQQVALQLAVHGSYSANSGISQSDAKRMKRE